VTAVAYHRHAANEARHFVPDMVDLYAVVFAEPPYNEGPEHAAKFRKWLTKELDSPGFTLVRAIAGTELVGMAYGYTMPAGEWWHNATEPPPADIRDRRKFVVMEWAVRADHRRRGIGRQLMTELLTGRSEPYATLNANPAAAARDIYVRWGWQQRGRTHPKNYPPMDILVLPLSAAG
jgi:ribosomal protein S18 acetylase RimI-like enzyme